MPEPSISTFRVGRSMQVQPTRGVAKGEPGNKALRRFHGKSKLDPASVTPLPVEHPALLEHRTMFPKSVKAARAAGALLVSGVNSRKLGSKVTKGAWRGMPIYSLTLEERATCPTSCDHWSTCYGNAMHLAKRIDHQSDDFTLLLQRELRALDVGHPRGFVVRLHALGDFYSAEYVRRWAGWLAMFPRLRIFGYTHWGVGTPIGAEIARIREYWWDRFAVRTSVSPDRTQIVPIIYPAATTIWRLPEGARVAEGIVCPAQTGATDCCGTCGLCWAEAAKDETIVFVGHGMTNRRGGVRGRDRKPRQGSSKGGRPRTAAYGNDTVAQVLLLRQHHTNDRVAELTGLTKGQIAGIVHRNKERT